MGFFSGLANFFGFGKNDAGQRAAAAKVKESRRGERRATGFLDPFFQAGEGQLGALEEGTTAGGLDARLGRIFDTESFGRLLEERTRAVQGQLSAGGLTRSGTALEQIANVPTQLGFDIENLLTQRSGGLASAGLQAGGALAGQAIQGGEFRGGARSSGIITDAQAQAKATQGLLNAVAGGITGFFR